MNTFYAVINDVGKITYGKGNWKRIPILIRDEHNNNDSIKSDEEKLILKDTFISGNFPSFINRDFIEKERQKDISNRTLLKIKGKFNNQFKSFDLFDIIKSISSYEIVNNRTDAWKACFLKAALLDKQTVQKLVYDKESLSKLLNGVKYKRISHLVDLSGMSRKRAKITIEDIDSRKERYAEIADSQESRLLLINEMNNKGIKYRLSDTFIDQILELDNDTKERFLIALEDNIYMAFKKTGFSIDINELDKIYLQDKNHSLSDKTRSEFLIIEYIKEYIKEKNVTYMPFDILKHMILNDPSLLKMSPSLRSKVKKSLQKAVSDLTKNNEIHLIKNKKTGEINVLLDEEYRFEQNLIKEIKILSSSKDFKEIPKDKIEEGIKASEKEQGFEFSKEQKKVIEDVINNKISTINGFAGTGKSTILRAVDSIFASEYNKKSIIQCAFTGRAADSLKKSSGMDAKTAHSYLRIIGGDDELDKLHKYYANIKEYDKNDVFFNNLKKRLSKQTFVPEEGKGMIIVDEYPTLDISIFACLLHIATVMNYRLILIGDSEQLPAIRISSDEIINPNNDIIHHELTKVERQDDDSMIYHDSLEIREGKIPELFKTKLKENDLTYHKDTSNLVKDIVYKYVSAAKDSGLKNTIILSPLNNDVKMINTEIHNRITKFKDPKEGFKIGKLGEEITVYPGEYVVNTVNQYNKVDITNDEGTNKGSLYNGNVGMVLSVKSDSSGKYMIVDFEGIGKARFSENDFIHKNLELAYAITIHRSQGSTIKNVIVAIRKDNKMSENIFNKQLLYTAMTRASDKMDVYINDDTMKYCIDHTIKSHKKTIIELLLDKDNYKEIK